MNREAIPLSYEPGQDGDTVVAVEAEECLVCDDRSGLSPAEQVERKLMVLLRSTPLRVSQLQAGHDKRSLS